MSDAWPPARVRQLLVRAVADALDVEPSSVGGDTPFANLGLSSVQGLSLVGALEEELDRPVPATMLYEYPTIDELSRALAADTAGGPQAAGPQWTAAAPPDPDDAICVVGMACRFPGGADTPELFWRNLCAGVDGSVQVPADRWDAARYHDPDPSTPGTAYTDRGGFLSDLAGFDAAFFGMPPAEALRTDPQQRLLLEVAWSALEDAGIAVDRLAGSRTGVFVGMMGNQEYARLQIDRQGDACLDDPFFGYGTAPSVAAGRLSYLWNLRGPNLCVDTACSSSLVAVHLAAESLQRGECDLAIVAGVSALSHPAAMVQACRAHMLAPDGHCKTFDDAADGFLMGEGCGVVVLQRRGDARARGHRVQAVLLGSAVNSDGRTNGMTAPSGPAQVAVIRRALERAGVAPGQVGYVEAHGSGTRLGDAIELAALQEVFGLDRPVDRPLVVGAVKTSIGHLLGAAGIAGLIKAVLAVRHGTVPPNLHLRNRSTAVDWARCPMLLPDSPVGYPDRAVVGVSSFGWSGTNAHVLVAAGAPVEERASAAQNGEPVLLPLSAASEAALRAGAEALHRHLRENPVPLADLAHTLRTGRSALPFRLPLSCVDGDDAIAALERAASLDVGRVAPGAPAAVTFLLPGMGDHYAGMGAGLYAAEPVYRAVIDRCAQVLRPVLGLDITTVLDTAETDPAPDLAGLMRRVTGPVPVLSDAARAMRRTDVAHSALFAVGCALAALWRHRGVPVHAVLGYSLGEYAAACVAGVFDLADAAVLVARRAQLLDAMPPGGMLAVASDAGRLPPLPHDATVAGYNGPAMTVVAGTAEALEGYVRALDAAGLAWRRVETGHALHTPLLEPLADRIAALVAEVPRRAPTVPLISSVTGTWITAEQVADPRYWAEQLTAPIRFADGVRSAAERSADGTTGPGAVLVELGPGASLTSLAGQILRAEDVADPLLVPTLRPGMRGHDRHSALDALGRVWAHGVDVDWSTVPGSAHGRSAALPTYPFEHVRFWPDGADPAPTRSTVDTSVSDPDADRWAYAPVWKRSPAPPPAAARPRRWLVFADDSGLADAVLPELRPTAGGIDPVVVRIAGPGQALVAETDGYRLDPDDAAGYRDLFARLSAAGRAPTHVLHCWSPLSTPERTEAGFLSVMYTVQALAAASVRMYAVTTGAYDIVGGDGGAPLGATVHGFDGCLDLELPGLRCTGIDVDAGPVAASVRALGAELAGDGDEPLVAYRNGRRWVRDWEPVALPATPQPPWRSGGVYLITGGFGGLGRVAARELARAHRARLVLLGRTPLPPRARWDDAAATDDRVAFVRELEALGAEVLPVAADVADPAAVSAAVAQARKRFGALHGVLHAAGVPAGGLIQTKSRHDVERVLAPKVAGTLALYAALRDDPPEVFALYSSAVVVLGGMGESDYCAANAFLDAFAWYARERGMPVTSIDWGPWQRDAWSAGDSPAAARLSALRRQYGITDPVGTRLSDRVLAGALPQVLLLPRPPRELAARWREVSAELMRAPEPARRYPRPMLRVPYAAPRTDVQRQVTETWERFLGVERVGLDDPFFELGGTSLVGLSIVAELNRRLGAPVSAADLFAAPTPRELAELASARAGGSVPPAPDPDGSTVDSTTRGQRRRTLARAAARRQSRKESST
ncbi:hypothetical protein Val02_56940 [Virgisporangium aliadipatigenens]|uniref:Uncharacterized protein n=1 Tax=Virgisporangium aliadipatigenens TaxID=741659 RepID=A0A8J4DTC5_9ACTN|nr:type I polyketide synthase [Virgisporangium aliadipatigenens]GIJ48808.1 hypothetical protein Val02_56940 [Virgisporangium aliadipatigenens]